MIYYYTQDKKLKIEQHEQHWKQYNDLLYTRQKTKNRVTRTALKTNNDLQNTTQKPKTEQHEPH
jgi:hypothetical protein